jgi:uncharacterized protein (UPF0332 family)
VFAPEDFLTLARRLMEQDSDEASFRTVISRAYYSVFLTVRQRLGAGGTSHKKLWVEVEKISPALAEIGQRLREFRNAADYGDAIPDLGNEAARCIRRANILLARVK